MKNTELARIKELRGKTPGRIIAEKANITQAYFSQIELGQRSPTLEVIKALASALNTTVAYLIGETDDPNPLALGVARFSSSRNVRTNISVEHIDAEDLVGNLINIALKNADKDCECSPDCELIRIPVLAINSDSSTGEGVSLDDFGLHIERWECVNREDLGPIEEKQGPFIVRVSGDSMEGAGMRSGDKLIVNPAAEVKDGNAALVCYGPKHEYAVKWVHWENDGGVIIRSANPRYQPRVFRKDEIERDLFSVTGKVVQVITKPLDG
jgi:transcriptional regulator with XRE-family HTH domain